MAAALLDGEDPTVPAGGPAAGPGGEPSGRRLGAASGAWAPWTAPVALVGGLAVALVGTGVLDIAGLAAGADLKHPAPALNIAGLIVQDAGLVLVAVMFAGWIGRRPAASDFGLRPTRWLLGVGLVVGGLVATLLFTLLWTSALGAHQPEHLPHDLGADRSQAARLAVAGVVCIVAPACEEIFFRGYFYAALRNWRGPLIAALVTGLTFGAVHAAGTPVVYLMPLAFFGFLLCLLYERTGSLYPGIALHSVNNALAFGTDVHWDWQIPVLMVVALGTMGAAAWALGRRSTGTHDPALA